MHARDDGECSDSIHLRTSMKDVSELMKRGAEKVSSPEDMLLEIVIILMSLGLVRVKLKLAELFCEGRFGDAAVSRVHCAMCGT